MRNIPLSKKYDTGRGNAFFDNRAYCNIFGGKIKCNSVCFYDKIRTSRHFVYYYNISHRRFVAVRC